MVHGVTEVRYVLSVVAVAYPTYRALTSSNAMNLRGSVLTWHVKIMLIVTTVCFVMATKDVFLATVVAVSIIVFTAFALNNEENVIGKWEHGPMTFPTKRAYNNIKGSFISNLPAK